MTNQTTPLVDAEQRRTAVEDTSTSFVVTAPAGSGKTELLVQRVLALLCQCQKPESILMITFTKKATAEMRHRITDALEKVDNSLGDQLLPLTAKYASRVLQRSAELNWQLLANPQRLNIRTIDSLCMYLAKNCLLENGNTALDNIVENSTFYYQLAIEQLLRSKEQKLLEATQNLLSYCDNSCDKLGNMLAPFVKSRLFVMSFLDIETPPDRQSVKQNFAFAIEQRKNQSIQMLKSSGVWCDLAASWDYARQNLTRDRDRESFHNIPSDLNQCNSAQLAQIVSNLVFTSKGEVRKTVNKNNGFSASPQKKAHIALLEHIREQPQIVFCLFQLNILPRNDIAQELGIIDSLLFVLPHLFQLLEQQMKQHSVCDFNAVALAARSAIGSSEQPTDLMLKLDYRFEHILVDEFQDTSYFQFELLEVLMSGWEVGDNRTCFLVGDAMQSIYSFRNAEVSLFENICHYGINDVSFQHLKLSCNFRSQPQLVQWVNANFVDKATQSTAVQTKVETYPAVKHNQFEDAEQEALYIAQQIKPLLASKASVAILVRYKNQIPQLVQTLQQHRIPIVATDTEKINDQPCILDIASLCKALYFANDRLSWLALLRSPLVGLTCADLFYIARPEGYSTERDELPCLWQQLIHRQQDCEQLSSVCREILQRVVPIIDEALQAVGSSPVAVLVQQCWLKLGGSLCYPNPVQNRHIDHWLSVLAEHFPLYSIDKWQYFEESLKTTYVSSQFSGEIAVELLTIHKAKGLEFDYVFIPQCSSKKAANNSGNVVRHRVERLKNQQPLLLIVAKNNSCKNSHHQWLKHQSSYDEVLELNRLFYVGCTRAKKQLFLSYQEPPKTTNNNTLYAQIRAVLDFQIHTKTVAENPTGLASAAEQEASPQLQRLPVDTTPSAITLLPQFSLEEMAAVDNTEQVFLGTLMHRILQYSIAPQPQFNLERWDVLSPILIGELVDQQVENPHQYLELLKRGLINTLQDKTGCWLLSSDHQQQSSELELHFKSGDTIQKGVVDRTFIFEGQRWIIDYKTIVTQSNKKLDIDKNLQRYRHKMLEYQTLFSKLQPQIPIVLMLYFPLQGQSAVYEK